MSEHKEELRKVAAAWLEAKGRERDAWDRQNKARNDYEAALKESERLQKELGKFVGRNIDSRMCRVTEASRVVVVRCREGWEKPDVNVFDAEGEPVRP
jgi:hypothetical protein